MKEPGRRGHAQRRRRPVLLPGQRRPTSWPRPTTWSSCARWSPATAASTSRTFAHEGAEVFDAIREAIEIGRRAGITVEILHIKIADQKSWGRMNEIVKLIDDARKQGINVGANVYPYTRGNNNLVSIIPPWAHEGGVGQDARIVSRIPTDRARIKKDIQEGIPGWYNHYTAVGGDWSRMLISGGGSFSGLTMDRVLEARRKNKKTARRAARRFPRFPGRARRLGEHGLRSSHGKGHEPGDDSALVLDRQRRLRPGHRRSDAAKATLIRAASAPFRAFSASTFGRRGLLRLEDAVRKMTSQNALKIGVYDRGLLRPGNWADITLFDPEHIIDRATYTNPFQYSEGVEYVLVNGQVVLERGQHTGATGRALRYLLEPGPFFHRK